jgi:GntR family transcriptional regulator, carbon starvation induced regulator
LIDHIMVKRHGSVPLKEGAVARLSATQTAQAEGATSLAIQTYARLRQDILDAVLAPNARLKARELCVRYEAGLSPVREALNRLLSESLVRHSAQCGFAVASFSLSELDEIVRTRRWIDEIGLTNSIRDGDDAWEERVVMACHRLSRTPRYPGGPDAPRNPLWYTAHRAFHLSLVEACGSEWLKSFSMTLFDAIERYRAIVRKPGDIRSTHQDEHRAIADAAVGRDAELAVRLLMQHYDLTAHLVREKLGKSDNLPRE